MLRLSVVYVGLTFKLLVGSFPLVNRTLEEDLFDALDET